MPSIKHPKSRLYHNPAGFKLWRKILRHKYGRAWRDYIEIG